MPRRSAEWPPAVAAMLEVLREVCDRLVADAARRLGQDAASSAGAESPDQARTISSSSSGRSRTRSAGEAGL
jgi:hypothetical protein